MTKTFTMTILNSNINNQRALNTQIKAGKPKAFEFAFNSYYPRLYKFACALLNDTTLADDIIQDVFLNLWINHQNILPENPLINYLTIAVRNSCYNALKSKKISHNIDINKIDVCCENNDNEENATTTPEHLWQSINLLPDKCRHVFKLVAVEQYKYKDAAEMLDVSVNTIKTQMKIAYKILRESVGVHT